MTALGVIGCAGYRIGTRSLYPPDIHTVYVPIFESDSYRRNLGEWLTEAVMKEIELKTPFKVVGSPNADSILSGRILTVTKGVTIEAPTDEPRGLLYSFAVEVSWIDRKGNLIQQTQSIPLPSSLVVARGSTNMYPELGQSGATAQQAVIRELAQQIVAMMEEPW